MPSSSNKIALFIDGANLYATTKTLGFDIDYKRLLKEFQSSGTLLRAFYYTAVIQDPEFTSIRPLIDWLDYNGYTVVTKATKEFIDASGRRKVKGNMDIELAVDAMELAAPERLHDEITADYNDMIYATTPEEIEARRKAFVRKWRLKHRAVADSLEEAGERLFPFPPLPPSQGRSVRTTNAIERLHEEFKRRIKTQTILPSADTAAMLFWALLASGQINMRKVDGWQTLATSPIDQPIDVAA